MSQPIRHPGTQYTLERAPTERIGTLGVSGKSAPACAKGMNLVDESYAIP